MHIALVACCVTLFATLGLANGRSIDEKKDKKDETDVLCWVDGTSQHGSNIIAVYSTWGALCDKLVFMVDPHQTKPSPHEWVAFNVSGLSERAMGWERTKQALAYIPTRYSSFKWVLFAKESTYIVVKNLREFLSKHNPDDELFFGRIWPEKRMHEDYDVFSVESGYVLSKGAIATIAGASRFLSPTKPTNDWLNHELSKSLASLDIFVTDVKGPDGLEAFLPLHIEMLRSWDRKSAYSWYYASNPSAKEKEECCSRYWIGSADNNMVAMVTLHREVMRGREANGKFPSELSLGSESGKPHDPLAESKPVRDVNWEADNDAGKILVFLLTMPKNHETKAMTVQETWGPLVDKLLFVTTASHPKLETIVVPLSGPESRDRIWEKTQYAWRHMYLNYLDDYDWFMKADDDTYVVVKNLRSFLAQYDSNELLYFGWRFVLYGNQPYMSGGGGYIISRAALKTLGDDLMWTSLSQLDLQGPSEDLAFGRWMADLHIPPTDAFGPDGRRTMFPLEINSMRGYSRDEHPDFWLFRNTPTAKNLEECCSRYWISSHYTSESRMRSLHREVMFGKEANGKQPSERMAELVTAPHRLPQKMSTSDVKVLCNVHLKEEASPEAAAIHRTWGSLCDKLIFTATSPPSVDSVAWTKSDGSSPGIAWEMTRESLLYIHKTYLQDFNWFLQANGANYFMMSNLKKMLAWYDPSESRIFGRVWPEVTRSGVGMGIANAAGYVLSKAALDQLGSNPTAMSPASRLSQTPDDEMNMAFDILNIPVHTVKGPDGLDAFLPLNIHTMRTMTNVTHSDYFAKNPSAKPGQQCCSRNWISSADMAWTKMSKLRRLEMSGEEGGGKFAD